VTKVIHVAAPNRDKLIAALQKLDGVKCQVGWFASAKYKDGTSVAYVASIQEYGYAPKNIPPRMGMRETIAEKQASWGQYAAYGARKVLEGTMTPYDALELLGSRAQGNFYKHISEVTQPPLTFATQAARARRLGIPADELTMTGAKPLNDTGLMIASLTHQVTDGKIEQ
jgi:hypothetical protein